MFGFRSDGRVNKKIDPIVRMTSVIMQHRCDAQVILKKEINYEKMSEYIKKKRGEGINISHMSIIVAAFVRTLREHPEFNRFVMNKKIYDRNEICVSYTILKEKIDNDFVETTIKSKFDKNDDIYVVSKKMQTEIDKNRSIEHSNFTDNIVKICLSVPFFPTLFINVVKVLDRYGLIPKSIINASPFHTSMFITNMASIRMGYVYHHIYNFGTTSIFFSMGKKEQKLKMDKEGNIKKEYVMPLGIIIDERICSGAEYAKGLAIMEKYLSNPELLEK